MDAVLCALLLLILPFFLPANQDVAWNLHVGRRLLLGDRLFVDVVEVNPPLILWLGSGIAWLASVSTVGGMQLYRLLVVIAIAACVLAVYRTLARDLGRERARVVAGTLLAVLAGLPGYNFGQREHLALVLAVPYLVAASAGGGGVIAGLAAGAGFALKPHFLAALIAVEGLRYARGQSVLRPALYAVVAVLLSCTSCVLLFLPEYLPAARSLGPAYWRLH